MHWSYLDYPVLPCLLCFSVYRAFKCGLYVCAGAGFQGLFAAPPTGFKDTITGPLFPEK
jgi:hypothetical protein